LPARHRPVLTDCRFRLPSHSWRLSWKWLSSPPLQAEARSLYRLSARTSGAFPRTDGTETNCHPKMSYSFRVWLLMPILTASGSCHQRESVVVRIAPQTRSHSCPWPLQGFARLPCRPPLPAPAALVLRLSCDRLISEPALARCPGLQRFVPRPPCVFPALRPSGPLPSWVFYPPGISPGVPLSAASGSIPVRRSPAIGFCSAPRSAFTQSDLHQTRRSLACRLESDPRT
jgi:hypothetical protein